MNLQEIARLERELVHFNMLKHEKHYAFPSGSISPNRVAIVGSCGHLFIGEGSNNWVSQLDGSSAASSASCEPWVGLFKSRSANADDLSVKMCNLIVPEKQVVLYNFYGFEQSPPSWNNRPAIRILNSLPDDLKVIYPAAAMISRQSWAELYWRGNSHWCASGCLTTVELILQDFGIEFDADVVSLTRHATRHDLQIHLMDDLADEEVLQISTIGTFSEVERPYASTGSHTGSQYVISNPAAAVNSTLVVFGDSYSYDAGLTYALSAFFTEVRFLWSKNINWDYVREHNAKFVVWESAERFLSSVPAS